MGDFLLRPSAYSSRTPPYLLADDEPSDGKPGENAEGAAQGDGAADTAPRNAFMTFLLKVVSKCTFEHVAPRPKLAITAVT